MTLPEIPRAFTEFVKVPCETAVIDDVSYETKIDRLTHYYELLLEWSHKMNLVAPSTLPYTWERHIFDSAQLITHLPEKVCVLVDMGSGAGFPGLVLSILGVPEVHLIESTGKKASFLDAVSKKLGLNVTVHNARIENIKGLKADVITARALTALPKLLTYAHRFMHEDTVALFLKGEKAPTELTEAQKYWTFDHKAMPSLTADSGRILALSNLKARAPYGSKSKPRKS